MSRQENAVVGEPPEAFQVPVGEAVSCFELVIDSNRTGLWLNSKMPVAPKLVPLNENVSLFSCCGESGPETQVLGGVGISRHPHETSTSQDSSPEPARSLRSH